MSILGIVFAALFIALAIWIVTQTDFPQPVKWFVAAVAIVICLAAALKLLGIDLGLN